MTLAELLTSQRRWGRTRARKFLLPLALNENKRIGTLTHRQRLMLACELEAKAGTAPAPPSSRCAGLSQRGAPASTGPGRGGALSRRRPPTL